MKMRGTLVLVLGLLAATAPLLAWFLSNHAKHTHFPQGPLPPAVAVPTPPSPSPSQTPAQAAPAIPPAAEPARPVAPALPEPDAAELTQQADYPRALDYISVTERDNKPSSKVFMKLILQETPADAGVLGISSFHLTTCVAGSGESVTDVERARSLDDFPPFVIAAGTVPRPALYLQFTLPPDARELAIVKADALLLQAGKRERVAWEYPVPQLPVVQDIAGNLLTLTGFSVEDSHVKVDIDCVWPPSELDEAIGLRPGQEMTLRYADGSSDRVWCGQASQKRLALSFTDRKNRTPAAFEFSFFSPQALEHAPHEFVLRHVPLPTRDMRTIAAGPRGPSEIDVDGITFSIQGLALQSTFQRATLRHELRFVLATGLPPELEATHPQSKLALLSAADEAGNEFRIESRPENAPTLSLQVQNPKADRLKRLAGKYVLIAPGEEQEESIELPEREDKSGLSLRKGALAPCALHPAADGFHFQLNIARNAMPEALRESKPAYGKGAPPFMAVSAYDTDGKALQCTSEWMACPDVYHLNCALPAGFGTARLVVRYPRPAAVREIPFEFKDIGIPRSLAEPVRPEEF